MTKTYLVDCPMQENDAGAETLADYFQALLLKIWEEGEGFSGKRPFGNSGWQYEVYYCLVKNGLVGGEIDRECEDLISVDKYAAEKFISEYLRSLF